MQYIISFLEGIITFISPCLLLMLPIYISYFAGGSKESKKGKSIINSIGFVLGFTVVFISMGAFAATLGRFLRTYQIAVNIISGVVVILFGLNFLGVLNFSIFKGSRNFAHTNELGFVSSIIFGMIFSIGWTPCVGVFLGSALMLASQQESVFVGIGMLLSYSLGLGIPFIISAFLIDKLKSTFDFIKRNYKVINIVSGTMLILIGITMMTGSMAQMLAFLSF